MLFLCLYFCLSFCRIVQTIPLISGAVSISGKESERAVLGYTYNRPFVTVVRRKGNIFPITTVRMMKMRVCLGQTTDEMPVRDMSVLLDNVDASSGRLKGSAKSCYSQDNGSASGAAHIAPIFIRTLRYSVSSTSWLNASRNVF